MVHAVVRGVVDLAQTSPLAGLEDFGKFWAELGTDDNPVEIVDLHPAAGSGSWSSVVLVCATDGGRLRRGRSVLS